MYYEITSINNVKFTVGIDQDSIQLFNTEGKGVSFVSLSSEEYNVLRIIHQFGNPYDPVSIRNIDKEFSQVTSQNEIRFNFVKNTLASIRKKYKYLLGNVSFIVIENDGSIIKNIHNNGYYINLKKVKSKNMSPAELASKISSSQPPLVGMLLVLFSFFHKSIFISATKSFVVASGVLLFIYSLQSVNILSNASYFSKNIKESIINTSINYSECSNNQLLRDILSESITIDSISIDNKETVCLISRDTVQDLKHGTDEYRDWSTNFDSFVYVNIELNKKDVKVRLPKNIIKTRYSNLIIGPFIDKVESRVPGMAPLSVGKNNSTKVFSYTLESGIMISLYSEWLLTELLVFTILIFAMINHKVLISTTIYIKSYINFSIDLVPVVDTRYKSFIYLEALSRFKGGNVQSVINNLRGCNLLIFHTIIIINMIAKKNHYNVKIGVNLCPTCLDGEGFNQLYKLLSQTASDNIVFELTENSGVEYTSQVIDRIIKIQLLGYDIAIDDFGVGNNNISLLDSISPRFVKIDRLFVTDIENSERQVSMARNLIDIAKSHSSIIIFEGVERISQKDALTDIGGLIQQGHLYHLSEDNKS